METPLSPSNFNWDKSYIGSLGIEHQEPDKSDKHLRRMIWERAITDMRLTTGSKGSACHLAPLLVNHMVGGQALLLAPILLTGFYVWPTVGDLPSGKSQLDLEPFGVGIPFGVWVRLPL